MNRPKHPLRHFGDRHSIDTRKRPLSDFGDHAWQNPTRNTYEKVTFFNVHDHKSRHHDGNICRLFVVLCDFLFYTL